MRHLTNDNLVETLRDGLGEAERRVTESDHLQKARLLVLLRGAHALLERAAEHVVASGDVSTESVGGDKP